MNTRMRKLAEQLRTTRFTLFLTDDRAYGPFETPGAAEDWAESVGYKGRVWSFYPGLQGEMGTVDHAHEAGVRLSERPRT
jgi:hypothetical protein